MCVYDLQQQSPRPWSAAQTVKAVYELQKDAAISPLTVEADAADVLEQFLPSGELHVRADPRVLRTKVPLHVV